MAKFLAVIIVLPILLIASMLITLLKAHIVLDIAQLYEVGFLTAISFKTMFGFLAILSLLWTSFAYNIAEKKRIEQDSTLKTIGAGFGSLITLMFAILLSWGFAYIANWMFF